MRAFAGLVLISIVSFAQSPSISTWLDERVPQALKSSGAPSVSVAVVENGKVVYTKAFGKANLEEGRDATPRDALRHRLHQ